MAAKSQKHYAVERSPGEGGDSGWAGGRAGGGRGGVGLAEVEEQGGWLATLDSRWKRLNRTLPSADIVLFCFVMFSLSISNF